MNTEPKAPMQAQLEALEDKRSKQANDLEQATDEIERYERMIRELRSQQYALRRNIEATDRALKAAKNFAKLGFYPGQVELLKEVLARAGSVERLSINASRAGQHRYYELRDFVGHGHEGANSNRFSRWTPLDYKNWMFSVAYHIMLTDTSKKSQNLRDRVAKAYYAIRDEWMARAED